MDGIVEAEERRRNNPLPEAMKGFRLRYIVGERGSDGEGLALVYDDNGGNKHFGSSDNAEIRKDSKAGTSIIHWIPNKIFNRRRLVQQQKAHR